MGYNSSALLTARTAHERGIGGMQAHDFLRSTCFIAERRSVENRRRGLAAGHADHDRRVLADRRAMGEGGA